MKRILHINSTIYINSGVMSVIMNYYENINRSNIQFDFLYFVKKPNSYKTYEKRIKELGGRVYYIPNVKHIISFNKSLDALLKKYKYYNTVHIHDPFMAKIIYRTLKKNEIKNIIIHSHASKWSDKKISGIRNKILCKKVPSIANYKFACSKIAGELLFKDDSFTIIKNAINVDKYKYNQQKRESVRKSLGIQKNTIVFGHVGNFNNQKNQLFLIDIMSEIQKINNNTILLLIGDGGLRSKIENKIKTARIDNKTILLGKKDNVEDYYNAMDCLILPSLYEGFPMVGIESQCNGLPVVASDTITKEIDICNCKFISLSKTPRYWAEESLKAATNNMPSDRCRKAQIIEKSGYSIKKEANNLEKIYQEIEGQKC